MDAARLFARISVAGADSSARQLRSFGAEVDRAQGNLNRIARGSGNVAGGIAKIGIVAATAAATGLTYAAKKFLDFDDAMAGVRKTVEGTPQELSGLYTELRKLATRIPVKFTDLAAIAQEAGALNVPTANIAKFTEVVSRLSAATVGLTPEAASEAFGKLGNVLGLNADKTGTSYERLASALVELGNKAASTESDIVEVAKRFGAAGHQAGLSAAEVLGFASAIASLGVEPEAAGSALSRIFNKITTFIGTGDEKIAAFAKATHMSVAEFKRAFAEDASGAVQDFIASLNGLDKFQIAKILKEGGLTNVRDVNVIQLLSQNYQELKRQVDLSTDAFQKNTALQAVSATRFDTLKNKLLTFWNLVQDKAVTFAEGFTPAIGRLLDRATTFLNQHTGDIQKMGVEVGKFIDDIDWTQVKAGADTVIDAAKTILSILKLIPPQIDAAVAGFLLLNKATGGAVGQIAGGALDIAKGGAGLAGRLLSMLPGRAGAIGGAVSALTATPVFVTNWPLGGIGAGIPGGIGAGIPGVAGAAGAGGGLLGGLASLALKVTIVGVAAGAASVLAGPIQDLGSQIHGILDPSGNDPFSQFGRAWDAWRKNADWPFGQRNAPEWLGGDRTPTNRIDNVMRNEPLIDRAAERRGAWAPGPAGNVTPQISRLTGEVGQALTAVIKASWAFRTEWKKTLDLATGARSGDQIRAAIRSIEKFVFKEGHGGSKVSQVLADRLRADLKHVHDPVLRAALTAEIKKLEAKTAGRAWLEGQMSRANRIMHNGHLTTAQKITRLQALEQETGKRTTAGAAKIHAKIEEEKKALRYETHATTQAIKDKDMKPVVTIGPTYVDVYSRIGVGETIKSTTTAKKLGNVYIS